MSERAIESAEMVQRRLSDDVLKGANGDYPRWSVDRGFDYYEKNLCGEDGVSPLTVALSAAERDGDVAVLDAGCGSGRALWDFRCTLQRRAGPEAPIRAVGVNQDDFRDESMAGMVRQEIANERLEYIVGDIGDCELEGTFDVITCYEVLVHMPSWEATLVLARLLPLLRNQGSLFCTIFPWQDQTVAYEDLLEDPALPFSVAKHSFANRKALRFTS
jgi:SAM-dependent methyltransferase